MVSEEFKDTKGINRIHKSTEFNEIFTDGNDSHVHKLNSTLRIVDSHDDVRFL